MSHPRASRSVRTNLETNFLKGKFIMKYLSIFFLISFFISTTACTDAEWDKYARLGDSAEVMCYSGGTPIFHATSTGKVSNEVNSDGYFARWQIHMLKGKWKHVPQINLGDKNSLEKFSASIGGDCIIVYVD